MELMKQLIEEMIGTYLDEDYDDLSESILDELSEETVEAIEEAILNELSPELLARYKKKALANRHDTDPYSSKAMDLKKKHQKARDKAGDHYFRDRYNSDITKTPKTVSQRSKDNAKKTADETEAELNAMRKTHKKRKIGGELHKQRHAALSGDDKMKHDITTLSAGQFNNRYKMTKTAAKEKLAGK